MMMKPYQSNKKTKTPKQKKGGEKTRNKMEGLTSKKTNEPPSFKDSSQGKQQVLESLQEAISNKEMGRPLKRTPSLDEPSPIVIAHLKTEITYTYITHVQTSLTPSVYKMCVKLKKECLWCKLLLHIMLAHR